MERRITPRLIALSLFLGIALAALPVEATDNWTVTGSPSGGYVSTLIVDPSTPTTLYSAASSGVFKSTDSGGTWGLVFPTLNGPNALVMDPLNPSILYVSYSGDFSKTLFKTTDGGATWNEIDNGIGTIGNGMLDSVGGLAVDPVTEGTVYAVSSNSGVYKSTDGGAHWSTINTGLSLSSQGIEVFLNPVAIDPVNPQVLYLPTQAVSMNGGLFSDQALSGIFQSTDGGAHWAQRVDHMGFDRVTVDPSNHTTVYAGGLNVYSSTNGGANWALVSSWPVNDVISVDPHNSQHIWGTNIFNGVYETINGGSTWNQTSLGTGILTNNVAMDPVTSANLYAATNWGVFKSTDSGTTWALSTSGIHDVVVNRMFEGGDGMVYLASGGDGIYKSADQGVSWAQVGAADGPTGSLPTKGDFVYTLVEDPTANSTLYAGTTGGVFSTTDGGDNWTETDNGIPGSGYTLALAMDPEATSTLYAATNTNGAGVYKSIDGGATWTASGNGLTVSPTGGFQALAVDPHHSNVVYAGAFATGLYKSTDGGASWQPDNGSFGVTDIWSVAVDPDDSNIVYTATSKGFFKSTDAGATWTESDYGLGGNFIMTNIEFDPSNSSIMYVTQRYGMGDAYISPDAGYTWYDMSTLTSTVATVAAKVVRREFVPAPYSRGLAGGSGRPIQIRNAPGVSITAAAIGSNHSSQFLGGAKDGQVYSFDVQNLPKGGHTQGIGSGGSNGTGNGGTSGGKSGASGGASGGGGGGDFSLLLVFGLGAFAARRRR